MLAAVSFNALHNSWKMHNTLGKSIKSLMRGIVFWYYFGLSKHCVCTGPTYWWTYIIGPPPNGPTHAAIKAHDAPFICIAPGDSSSWISVEEKCTQKMLWLIVLNFGYSWLRWGKKKKNNNKWNNNNQISYSSGVPAIGPKNKSQQFTHIFERSHTCLANQMDSWLKDSRLSTPSHPA